MPYGWTEPEGDEDRLHRWLRCPRDDFHRAMRQSFDDVFAVFEPLVTDHWLREVSLAGKTLARFWEAYVGATLLDAGLHVWPEREGLPDFQVSLPTGACLWVECVTPTLGDPQRGDSAVQPPALDGTLVRVPTDALLARVAQAVDGKRRLLKGWRSRGVGDADPVVIAINDVVLTDAFGHGQLGRVLAPAYGIGNQVLLVDRNTGVATDAGWEPMAEVRKRNGSKVAVGWFCSDRHASLSGLLAGSIGPHKNSRLRLTPFGSALAARRLGSDLEFLHNPRATAPLPPGLFPCAREWERHGDSLVSQAGRAQETSDIA